MRKITTVMINLFLLSAIIHAQGYKVGDVAADFSLKNVDGSMISLSDYPDKKGFVVVFTCNHCPYAKAYEQRIIDIHNTYASQGYPVIAINPNDPEIQPNDSYEKMQERAEEKGFPFPYLIDETQEIYRAYGATRTPHIYLLKRYGEDLKVTYIGTIDDNYKDASAVTEPYLANAIDALLVGKTPNPDFTKAIGCSIKDKRTQK